MTITVSYANSTAAVGNPVAVKVAYTYVPYLNLPGLMNAFDLHFSGTNLVLGCKDEKITKINAQVRFATIELDSQSGQASVFLLVILGTFLLASVGFAVDLSSMWFHRQTAQSAADAACVAGAMDMLYLHNGTITSSPGFTVGTAGDCASSSSAALCQYAAIQWLYRDYLCCRVESGTAGARSR